MEGVRASAQGFCRQTRIVRKPMAIRAQNDAFADFPLNGGDRPIVLDHDPDSRIFFLAILMMELKRPAITETALRTTESLLQILQPTAKVVSPPGLSALLADAALVPAVHFLADGLADLKTGFILLNQAIPADLPRGSDSH